MTNLKYGSGLLIILLLIISCDNPVKDDNDDLVAGIIDAINLDSLTLRVQELSGDVAVTIGGNTHTIESRHMDYNGNILAANFLKQKLSEYGLDTEYQFNGSTQNVIGIQVGKIYPDQYYIICAHYDCYPDSSIAPGADDNASGTATVLEAARILSRYNSDYSIIYALWDEEEQGLRGGGYYAWNARQTDQNIRGVINIDMIGWDSNNDGRFYINVRDTASSVYLSEVMLNVYDAFKFDLAQVVLNPGSGSDNLAFWYFGYGAIGIEEMYGEDWNEYYHTTGDQLDKFNLPYFYNCARLVIGTVAVLALDTNF